MTKLDWSKGYTPDPARVQSVEDFSGADPIKIISITPLKKPLTSIQLEVQRKEAEARWRKARARKAAKEKAIEDHRVSYLANIAVQREKRAEEKARRAKRLKKLSVQERARRRSPEHAAKLTQEREKIAPKVKSHLQTWVEEQPTLREDRVALRLKWKERLLQRREQ